MLSDKTIAVIGLGKLGESLARSLISGGAVPATALRGTAAHEETLKAKADLGMRLTTDNAEAVRGADVVLLCVKPQAISDVLAGLRDELTAEQLVVSTAAGVTTAAMERLIGGGVPVVRTMPNTPCLVGAGMTALCAGAHAGPDELALARELFDAVGRTMILDEKHVDAVTGLSGSGPAFMYVVMEALAEGGLKMGLPRQVATELVAQTMLGAATLALETGEHPAKLKDAVLTPAGCTIDGLLELEDGGLRTALIKAVVRATVRSSELSDEPST